MYPGNGYRGRLEILGAPHLLHKPRCGDRSPYAVLGNDRGTLEFIQLGLLTVENKDVALSTPEFCVPRPRAEGSFLRELGGEGQNVQVTRLGSVGSSGVMHGQVTWWRGSVPERGSVTLPVRDNGIVLSTSCLPLVPSSLFLRSNAYWVNPLSFSKRTFIFFPPLARPVHENRSCLTQGRPD